MTFLKLQEPAILGIVLSFQQNPLAYHHTPFSFAEMEITKRTYKAIKESIRNDMTNLVNKKGVGGNAFHTNDILEAIQKITSRF